LTIPSERSDKKEKERYPFRLIANPGCFVNSLSTLNYSESEDCQAGCLKKKALLFFKKAKPYATGRSILSPRQGDEASRKE